MLKCYIHDIWYEGTKCPHCLIGNKSNRIRKREKLISSKSSDSQYKSKTEKKWFDDGW